MLRIVGGGEKKLMTALIKKNFKGFTLIELLIVMAILGVLAVVVLIAINPVQQLARTRDAGRKSGVTQIGHAVEAYYTARSGQHPVAANWLSDLSTSGELSTMPSQIVATLSGFSTCSASPFSGWCYNTANGAAIVYTGMESNIERTKCTSGYAWFVYSTADGRGGIVCSSSAPTAGSQASSWAATQ